MTYLLSTLALLAAPLAYGAAERRPGSRQALEGFVLITITGIVCLHIVPDAWQVAGLWSGGFLLLGLGFPMLLERIYQRALERAHLVVLGLAAVGIVLHAVLDGIALLPGQAGDRLLDNKLALGVILHRLPVGVAVWWVLRPRFGTGVAISVFVLIVAATGASYVFGGEWLEAVAALALFQSFVSGSLVHVALFGLHHEHHEGHGEGAHAGEHARRERMQSWPFRVGVVLGLLTVLLLPHVQGG